MISDPNLMLEIKESKQSCYFCDSINLRIKFPSIEAAVHTEHNDSNSYCCTSFGHNKHGDILECLDCGLISLKDIPDRFELEQIYKKVIDPLYIEEKENRYFTFNKIMKDIQKYTSNGKLLDVGCYCGYFLDVASEKGFDVQGVELSEWACLQARQLGFQVHNDNLSSLDLESHFDTITMWDVIEHFSDPSAELREVNRLLKSGGYLFLSTINAGSFVARLMGSRWPWLMDMHIFYFNTDTMTKILEEEGFSVVHIQNYTHYTSSKYLIKKLNHISKFGALFPKALQGVFGEFNLPFNLGDNMMVIAKKL